MYMTQMQNSYPIRERGLSAEIDLNQELQSGVAIMKQRPKKGPMNWPSPASSSTQVRSMMAGRPMQVEVEINSRAYELYLQRGCEPGRELEDWLRAEQELMHQRIHTLAM